MFSTYFDIFHTQYSLFYGICVFLFLHLSIFDSQRFQLSAFRFLSKIVYLMMYSECSFIVFLFGKKVSSFICSFFFTGRVVDSARMCRDGVVGGVSRRTSLLIRLFYGSFVHSSIPLSKA